MIYGRNRVAYTGIFEIFLCKFFLRMMGHHWKLWICDQGKCTFSGSHWRSGRGRWELRDAKKNTHAKSNMELDNCFFQKRKFIFQTSVAVPCWFWWVYRKKTLGEKYQLFMNSSVLRCFFGNVWSECSCDSFVACRASRFNHVKPLCF